MNDGQMSTAANITLRFTFVALSVLIGAVISALCAMWAIHAVYVAVNGQPDAPNAALFLLLGLACPIAGSIGGSLSFLGALLVLYVINHREQRVRQTA